ncbi:unnamed protein product [Acidithrix sp. C25]|nr:unnamed protein product [Acidithrix sp. C25]
MEFHVQRRSQRFNLSLMTAYYAVVQNKPAYVPHLSKSDIEDLYFVRIQIETSVVRHLAKNNLAPSAALKAADELPNCQKMPPHPSLPIPTSHFTPALWMPL